MSAKRSPILGYNHNVRYRGIVFHVQTEDSGIINPHVFTHLFHGGTILSSRKMVYDPGSAEESVKSLMQAQHKAAMKDLKRGAFDAKIDSYLVDVPGLLPRNAVPVRAGSESDTSVPLEVTIEVSEPTAATEAELHDYRGERTDPIPTILDSSDDTPTAASDTMGRAPTERVAAWMKPGPTTERLGARVAAGPREVSQAINAIHGAEVGDDELATAGLVEVAEIHSPALPSAAAPPGLQQAPPAGQYSVTRRPSTPIEPLPKAAAPAPASAPPARSAPATVKPPTSVPAVPRAAAPAPATSPSTLRNVAPPVPSTSGPVSRPTAPTIPRPNLPPGAPDPVPPQVPRAPVMPAAKPPTQPHTPRGRPVTGGVVVSRPAVIVGSPPKQVGTPAPGVSKIRRARDTHEGIGGDLISERSLDEVILAYLSEDTSEE